MKRPYLYILALSVINIKTRAVYLKYKVMVCEMAKHACVCIFCVCIFLCLHVYNLRCEPCIQAVMYSIRSNNDIYYIV